MKHAAAPRGTSDVLPAQARRWQALERVIDRVCRIFGYGEIRTPIFESTEVFVRTIGESTDIVEKEMYTFVDRGGRSVTLRPELTAPVVRAVLEHNLLQSLPLKLYYRGPFFRYERPQKGRYRQAHQFGIELFGVEGPEADVEVIALAVEFFELVGVRDYALEVNSMGCAECRERYREALVKYLRAHAAGLTETSRERLERNPLRILDSKDEADKKLLLGAPTIDQFWCAACRAHFDEVQRLLKQIGIDSRINKHIVRGLDYYTRTVFEFTSTALGAQNAICGGGRYDGLVKAMGGPATPGVGFAMGIERLLLLLDAVDGRLKEPTAPWRSEDEAGLTVAFIGLEPEDVRALVPIMHGLRRRGIAADMDYSRRKLEKQVRAAGEAGALFAVIVGGDERAAGEATIQDLQTRERERVKLADVGVAIERRLSAR